MNCAWVTTAANLKSVVLSKTRFKINRLSGYTLENFNNKNTWNIDLRFSMLFLNVYSIEICKTQ